MASPGLYEQVLAALGAGAGGALAPPRPPRASAAVVPWRRDAGGAIEVFWIQRAPELQFMGGWHAFPGGALAREDAAVPIAGSPRDLTAEQRSPQPDSKPGEDFGPDLVPGLAAAALRELEEETGLRVEDASRLVFAGRWLTPPLGPLRFDNRFFLLEWPAGEPVQPRFVAGESVAGEWLRAADAVARWRSGDVVAAPPVLHVLNVLAEDGPERGLRRLRDTAEANLGSFRRIEFRPGILLFPLATPTLPPATHTNAILLGHGDAVLIDPGSPYPDENRRLLEALAAAAAQDGRRVTAIWLTHHHPDHVGGVQAVRQALSVPVLAHAATAQRLAEQGIPVDRELRDGERVRLAGPASRPPMMVEVVHTPGHTRGHLVFLVGHESAPGVLIAGDLVSGLSTIVIDPPEGDMDAYLASLARARDLRPEVLIPAHGPMLLRGADQLDDALRHRLAREERVLAAWRAGLHDPTAMVDSVYEDTPGAARPLAARQIAAHLQRLRSTGAV